MRLTMITIALFVAAFVVLLTLSGPRKTAFEDRFESADERLEDLSQSITDELDRAGDAVVPESEPEPKPR